MTFSRKPPVTPPKTQPRTFFRRLVGGRDDMIWSDPRPIRSELFGLERLAHHAQTLAADQKVAHAGTKRVIPLAKRLKNNEKVLFDAYEHLAEGLRSGQSVTPAAEWLLDNFHIVEEQIRQITTDLPPGYYRQLPKLTTGPFAGYPRVFGIAWAFVAHTDSLFSQAALERFVSAYQVVDPLTIGELWAIAISLRIVLVENMRRLTDLVVEGMGLRAKADQLVDSVLGSKTAERMPLHLAVAAFDRDGLPEIVAGQLVKRLRGYDPAETPLLAWLVDMLKRSGQSLDDVVQNRQAHQGATNVSMRNIVTSMRALSEADWPKFVEKVSLVHARLSDAQGYLAMDFATRNQYRTAIENLARGTRFGELDVTDKALAVSAMQSDAALRDPGHVLIGAGRPGFEAELGFTPPFRLALTRSVRRAGLPLYLASIAAFSVLMVLAILQAFVGGLSTLTLCLLGLLLLPLASDFATAITNLFVTRFVPPEVIPSLDFEKGIPDDHRTLVVVPVLLGSLDEVDEQIERLEVHALSSVVGAVHYLMLSDFPDAGSEHMPDDTALVERARAGIADLNAKYPSDVGTRFLLLHRHRLWNPSEGKWMGWERKRGKLVELNRLLRGDQETSFMHLAGMAPNVPQDVRFVITLDADTGLVRDSVHRLVGKIAHPLNRPRFDPAANRVISGYGILQPRVTPALPSDSSGSLYARIFSGPGGIDPYASAASDVYQDLFGEGSFTGKGIYDVDAFMQAMGQRVPENAMLSHDLFEGTYARAGLASDVEVVEEFPARYDVDARRHHRWVRGDWQLLPWIFGARGRDLSALGRAKMLDNLRRSILAPATLAALTIGWLLSPVLALGFTQAILLLIALPFLLSLPFDLLPASRTVTWRSHFAAVGGDARAALVRIVIGVALIPFSAYLMIDAIARTLIRVFVTRKRLLEWVTAAQSGRGGLGTPLRQYVRMFGGLVLAFGATGLALALNPSAWPVVLPFALIWAATPLLMHAMSLPSSPLAVTPLDQNDEDALRRVARKTWRYFDQFVTAEENFLPPDNFQEIPHPVVAHRTSPTNIGLYLLSTVVARDLQWITRAEVLRRLEDTLATMGRMARLRGHFYNWYDTNDLRVLPPDYISSVDSGNLAGHLIAVAQACEATGSVNPDLRAQAIGDALELAREALTKDDSLSETIGNLAKSIKANDDPESIAAGIAALPEPFDADVRYWLGQARLACFDGAREDLAARYQTVADLCRRFAMEMDFSFLVDPDKKLLSIGYSASSNALDPSCYDLLASEARLASLFAIAKGDVETRHWFRLGRSATPMGAGSALISWSGSMFEYLMPALVLQAPVGSVLEQTSRLIVARQRSYGDGLGLPWGISESAYNARDLEMTYQYSNFGVPGLGLKRGLTQNQVIAPYATGLASMVDATAAAANYARLERLGACGRYGFYEAVDFTNARVSAGKDHALVQSFMAHHQGMTITAIANVLLAGRLRDWFHAEPIVQSIALLLQERVPRHATSHRPRAEKVVSSPDEDEKAPGLRRFDDPEGASPTTHVLSNPQYALTLTPGGGGHSQWHDIAITRRNDDPSRDAVGSYIFLRDLGDGAAWSATAAPLPRDGAQRSAVFAEHQAEFTHRGPRITTKTEVVVSPEDNAEARRVTLTNTSRHERIVDVTSYVELALAPPASDRAHPAFSKMFVVTDFLPELEVLVATRRKRGPEEREIWVAHLAVVEGEEAAQLQFETDRARFIGRGRNLENPAGLSAPLSGSKGTVLDPVFAMRRTVTVPVGRAVKVTFWTLIAETSDELLALVERHRDPSGFSRAVTLAWTQSQVQLRHLAISHAEASDFQRLAGIIGKGDPRLRAPASQITAGAAAQSALWSTGISGDLPIVLLKIDDVTDIAQVQEALAAFEYWAMRHVPIDLVILNERSSSYVQDLQQALETAVRAIQLKPIRPRQSDRMTKARVFVLRSDLVAPEARALLISIASVVLVAGRGRIGGQFESIEASPKAAVPARKPVASPPPPKLAPLAGLEFFNGIGGFADEGREYVCVLENGETTPAPWINVIANPGFGCHVSAEGSGAIWAENSRENLLTPWSNDAVSDTASGALYIRDLVSGALWTPTALPIRTLGRYVARHGFGYTRFEHEQMGITSDLVQFVPQDAAVKVSHLTLTNTTRERRILSVTGYAEWVLGTSRAVTAHHIQTEHDRATGAIFARNPFSIAFAGRVAFADIGEGDAAFSADRAAFLGSGGSLANPLGLRSALNGKTGPALDPCAALQRKISLAPGESVTVTFLIGQAENADAAREVILRMRAADKATLLDSVKATWRDALSTVQVETPDRAMDIMLNGWLLYQTLSCRIWARAGFYQASGAYGFRDQLQDNMALTLARPDMTREHLLRVAGRQFPEGDVQHWWLPHSGQGVRTHISDDRVWLGFATALYIETSGDHTVLDEVIPFLEGPKVPEGQHDAFYQPHLSDESASLFEHAARGLDLAIAKTGANGLPLIGTGDWNDGMNRVGEAGKGTSVWLGWLLIKTLKMMIPHAESRDSARAQRWRTHAEQMAQAIEREAWDGAWYRRGTYDDGTPLGTAAAEECRIDSIAQSWSVLSGVAPEGRARQAMDSVMRHLVKRDPDLALLFTPAFDSGPHDPGYIKGYPPGLRENGGQYSHAAMWAILAQARLGDGDAAADLFALVNPINHAKTSAAAALYKVEPYVVAADVYFAPGLEGRGGWTWYTGSAGWMYRAGIEGVAGLTRHGETLHVAPCFPKAWPKVSLRVKLGETSYWITVLNRSGEGHGVKAVHIDGRDLGQTGQAVLALDGNSHEVEIEV